mgnify:CR=1 FL=1
MGILVGRHTRVVVQGITGREGKFHAGQMREFGTQVVAGVTPGRGGETVEGVPVFNSVHYAVKKTEANVACIFVPAAFAADAILEAADASVEGVVVITEGIPTLDMIRVCHILDGGPWLLGPNCPGIVTVPTCKIGIMPGKIFAPGNIGLMSRSGTLTYEIVAELTRAGFGQSTCIGVGGDPVIGSVFVDLLALFENDEETEVVVLIGEIGGTDEEEAATFIENEMNKPVVAFVAGRTAPPGKQMGHAGAIVSGGMGTAQSKIKAFEKAGIPVAEMTADIPNLVKGALNR